MILSHALYEDEIVDDLEQLHYVPEPPQRAFHTCPADHVLYGGAAGGGKTLALTMEGIQACIEEPGIRVIYFRLTFDDLQQQIDETRRFIPEDIAKFNGTRHRWEFAPRVNTHDPRRRPRQSYFNFRYLDSESDAQGYQSREYDIIMFDEATQFSEGTIEFLTTRLRTALPGGWPRLRMGTNPGGISHQYLMENWVEPVFDDVELLYYWDWTVINPMGLSGDWVPHPPGTTGRVDPWVVWRPHPNAEQREAGEQPATRAFVPAKVDDNPHIDRGYKRSLMGLKDEALRAALLHGDWHIFSGQAFRFREDIHVDPEVMIHPSWRKWRSIDWGWENSATCVLWHAYDPERKRVITYRELYGYKINDKELCERINALTPEGEWIDFTAADPSMFRGSSNEMGMTRDIIFARYGVYLQPAINSRPAGFSRVQDALAIHQGIDEASGKIFEYSDWVCTPNCYNLRRSLPTLMYDKSGKDIYQKNADDHCLVQGTLVLTPQGWIPIETIAGARIMRYDASIIRLITEDGYELRCTSDHKIMTPHGWVEAQFLHQNSVIQWWSPGPLNVIGEPVTTSADSIFSAMASDYIASSGRIITDLSRRAIMSTTETMIAPTIPLGISNYSQSENISVVIPVNPLIANGRRGERMQFATPEKAIRDCQRSNGVKRLSGVMHERESVNVWDISVDHPLHGFVAAGGFIVHNCYDALRYALLATPAFVEPYQFDGAAPVLRFR